ncbi:antibiotic biosynthesis monooxygenase family protein [Parendozoicomonas haliclonae]|uniref:ABM domain-containing protein n=1 Tax=Parendozoicomonas haliclonae TaxID=1960125 RepID=A0A1X7AQX2_9GAMM|nr:antibiotic biosynthesis monooxygenase [Parendozoicomonas haliclonae]SMA50490.1 hypothetical protein EHSB41UT_04301 [Parendozoicomonas haliclonae]
MFVVIFQAILTVPEDEYLQTASQLRELALNDYGCLKFVAMTEGDQELALSWWADEESIRHWKQASDHLMAQQLGRERWYSSYSVEVGKITRKYAFPEDTA